MTLLKRLATSAVLFIPLFVFFYIAICAGGAGIYAGIKSANSPAPADPHEAFVQGQQNGTAFVAHNLPWILLGAFLVSVIISLALSFSGLLPWCRKSPKPPVV